MSDLDLKDGQSLDDGGDYTPEQEEMLDPEARTILIQKRKMRQQRDEARKLAEEANKRAEEAEKRLADFSNDSEWKLNEIIKEQELIKFTMQHRELWAEAITELKDVAKAKWLSLEDAYNTPVFKAYVSTLTSDETIIPSNNRSAHVSDWKDLSKLNDEEHRKYLREKYGIL